MSASSPSIAAERRGRPSAVRLATDQTLEKARALGDRVWRLERVASAEAWLDPSRITQAWLQLAANAVKYSSPGSVITLGSRLHRGEVQLWVRDEGIGVEPAARERLEALSFAEATEVLAALGATRTGWRSMAWLAAHPGE